MRSIAAKLNRFFLNLQLAGRRLGDFVLVLPILLVFVRLVFLVPLAILRWRIDGAVGGDRLTGGRGPDET